MTGKNIVKFLVAMVVVGCCLFIVGCSNKAEENDFQKENSTTLINDTVSKVKAVSEEMRSAKEDDAILPTPSQEAAEAETIESTPEQHKTCIIAQYEDIDIHSPIKNMDLTGVLFHQASYAYGLVMTTALPSVNGELVNTETGTRINKEQTNGDEWLDADALHLYRWQDNTNMDTSIDVGASAGAVVYAPVDGVVTLVKDYMLYGYVPDIEIHIQPAGHPELDLVLLHQYDPMVKAGDSVLAGITPISHVRNLSRDLTGIQLADYTLGDDPGNHSHVQINDVLYPGYYEEKLLDQAAFVTPERQKIHDGTVAEIERREREAEEQTRKELEEQKRIEQEQAAETANPIEISE